MDKIELGLKKSNLLDDKTLEKVSSGAVEKGTANIIKTVTTISGIGLGTVIGGGTGLLTGGAIGGLAGVSAFSNMFHGSGSGEISAILGLGTATVGGAVGGVGGAGVGGLSGGILGHKLGKWICKKTGVEEN